MKGGTVERLLLTVVMVAAFFLAMEPQDTLSLHAWRMFLHVNVWHLAGNLFVLWMMLRGELYLLPSLVIGFVVSFLPAWSIYGDLGVTLGFSGVLFAIVGVKWGRLSLRENHKTQWEGTPAIKPLGTLTPAFRQFLMKPLPIALVGVLVPHLNWCVHTYALIAGYIYGRYRR